MSVIKTSAIVLRYANYGENNRMLTLLTPALGLLSVSARGCRKATSRNLTAVELFTTGEYLLYQKEDRYTLTSFQLQESYYPIRMDVDKLAHGVYWLNLCEAVSQPAQPAQRLLKMLLLSLAVLSYGELPPRPLTSVFLMQFSILQGFSPWLESCVGCGGAAEGAMVFDVESGGVRCGKCGGRGLPLSPECLAWLREAQQKGAYVLAGRRPLPEQGDEMTTEAAFAVIRAHVEHRLEKHAIAAARFL